MELHWRNFEAGLWLPADSNSDDAQQYAEHARHEHCDYCSNTRAFQKATQAIDMMASGVIERLTGLEPARNFWQVSSISIDQAAAWLGVPSESFATPLLAR